MGKFTTLCYLFNYKTDNTLSACRQWIGPDNNLKSLLPKISMNLWLYEHTIKTSEDKVLQGF